MSALAKRFPALATRDAQIFYAGQFLSLIGTWMQNTVQPYLAYRITGQPIYLGLVGFSAALPALLFTLAGGVFIERIDKRKAVIVLQIVMMLQAFILAALTLTGNVTIWHIIILSFVLGTANSIEITARQAWMIELVGRNALPNAIGLQSSIFNTARVLGPAISAPFLLFVQNGGEGWAFLANGISYVFVLIGLLIIRPTAHKPAPTPAERLTIANGTVAPSALAQFREGQNFIRHTPLITLLIAMSAVAGFMAFPVIQQVPVFARDVLHQAGDTDMAVAARNSAMSTAQGVGALIAALALTMFSTFRPKGRMLTIGQFAVAFGLLGLGLSNSLVLTLLAVALFGWGTVTALANTNTVIQLITPHEMRGRVISTYLWALQGITPFGSLFIGWLAQNFGAQACALVAGVFCLIVFGVIHLRTPLVRTFESN